MYRASPPRFITDLALAAVAAVQSAPTSGSAWVNLEASHVTHDSGFAHGVYALLPDKAQYDMIRVGFSQLTIAGTDPTATITVWAMGSDEIPYIVGQSVMAANNTFPNVEFENHQFQLFITLSALGGTATPKVTATPYVQGLYSLPYSN